MTPKRLSEIEVLLELPCYPHSLVTELIRAVRRTHRLYQELQDVQVNLNLSTSSAVTMGGGSFPVRSELRVETLGDTALKLYEAIKEVKP